MKYKVHQFNMRMYRDQKKLEDFLNNLEGELIALIPHVRGGLSSYVDFLLIVEKVG